MSNCDVETGMLKKENVKSTHLEKHYIKDPQSLIELCRRYEQSEMLAIDTEFVRTRTLYPKLGLLQINNGEHLALIDPIHIDDLSPFWQLLSNPNIVKVLHACSEDLEVFLTAANCKPVNLIDSQIMMSFLGHGLSIGYAAMIKHYFDIELDKSESRTDWTKRPLSEKQLRYAQADVEFLYRAYPKILTEIQDTPWLVAAQQETQLLIEKKFSPIDTEQLHRNVKMSWRLNPKQLCLLKALAIWRYEQAQKRDMPIGFIAKDNTLLGLAQHNPKSIGAMANIEGVDVLDIRHKGKAMLAVLNQASLIEAQHYPEKIVRLDEYPGYKQIFKKVKNFIADIGEQSGQTVENLASKKQINQFLAQHFKLNDGSNNSDVIDIMVDWRFDLFGKRLQEFANNDFK
ncbi:ribonuclease D [Colwelliaceae bacterium 6471]